MHCILGLVVSCSSSPIILHFLEAPRVGTATFCTLALGHGNFGAATKGKSNQMYLVWIQKNIYVSQSLPCIVNLLLRSIAQIHQAL